MKMLRFSILLLGIAPLVSACASPPAPVTTNPPPVTTDPPPVVGPPPVADYSTYADSATDTVTVKAPTDGLTGLAVRSVGGSLVTILSEAELVFSADLNTVNIYLDGVLLTTLRKTFEGATTRYSYSGVGINGPILADQYHGIYDYNDGNTNTEGYIAVGVETRPENLPTSATYNGTWDAKISGVHRDSGIILLSADFPSQSLTGQLFGGSLMVAGITAAISGNEIDGTANFSGVYSGTTALKGTFYGPWAEGFGGVFLGQVSDGSGVAEPIIGNINGYGVP